MKVSKFVKIIYFSMVCLIASVIVDGVVLPRMISSTDTSEVILGLVLGVSTLIMDGYMIFSIIKYLESKDS